MIFLAAVCIAMPAIALSIYQGNVYSEKAYVHRGIGGTLVLWIHQNSEDVFAEDSISIVEKHIKELFPEERISVEKAESAGNVIVYSSDDRFLTMTCYPSEYVKQGTAETYQESKSKLGQTDQPIKMYALPLNPASDAVKFISLQLNSDKTRLLNKNYKTGNDILISIEDYNQMQFDETPLKGISIICEKESLYPELKKALADISLKNTQGKTINQCNITFVDADYRYAVSKLHTAGWGEAYINRQRVISLIVLFFTLCTLVITLYATIFSMIAITEKRKKEFRLYEELGMRRRQLLHQIIAENTIVFLAALFIACFATWISACVVTRWIPSNKTVMAVTFARRVDFLGLGGHYLFLNAPFYLLLSAIITYAAIIFGTLRSTTISLQKRNGIK